MFTLPHSLHMILLSLSFGNNIRLCQDIVFFKKISVLKDVADTHIHD